MRIQVRLSQASDIVEKLEITQVYINKATNDCQRWQYYLYCKKTIPSIKPSRMVTILVRLSNPDQCIVYVVNHSFQSKGHFIHNNLLITIRPFNVTLNCFNNTWCNKNASFTSLLLQFHKKTSKKMCFHVSKRKEK